jgi:hypothetical protein
VGLIDRGGMQWKLAMKKKIDFDILRQLALEPATQSEVKRLTRPRPTCHAHWGEGRRHRSAQASAARGRLPLQLLRGINQVLELIEGHSFWVQGRDRRP